MIHAMSSERDPPKTKKQWDGNFHSDYVYRLILKAAHSHCCSESIRNTKKKLLSKAAIIDYTVSAALIKFKEAFK